MPPKKKIFNESDSGEEHESDDNNDDDGPVLKGDDEDSEDSDGAPDDVTFATSRLDVLQKVHAAVQQITSDKEKLKGKRRQRQEEYAQQKKQKLEKLVSRKLPDDFLENLKEEAVKSKEKVHAAVQQITQEQEAEEEPAMSDDDFDLSDGEETEEFIPLDRQPGVRAVHVKDYEKTSRSAAESAAKFKQDRLFGRHVRREPIREKLAKIAKRKARFL